MLTRLRSPAGGPALRTRLLAVLVVLGMVVLTAPLVLVPVIDWLAHLL